MAVVQWVRESNIASARLTALVTENAEAVWWRLRVVQPDRQKTKLPTKLVKSAKTRWTGTLSAFLLRKFAVSTFS